MTLLTAARTCSSINVAWNGPGRRAARLLGAGQADEIMRLAYRPHHLLLRVQRQMTAWHRDGRLSDILLATGLAHLDKLTQAAGACERIRTTPVPYPCEVLLHRTTYFYCVLLPFGLVESIGWATPSFPSSSPTPSWRCTPSRENWKIPSARTPMICRWTPWPSTSNARCMKPWVRGLAAGAASRRTPSAGLVLRLD